MPAKHTSNGFTVISLSKICNIKCNHKASQGGGILIDLGPGRYTTHKHLQLNKDDYGQTSSGRVHSSKCISSPPLHHG